ncbi:MAG: DUF502 domain-containing protein [Phycisphaerales bacterium]
MTTTQTPARTFSSDFKRFFVRGLVILLPSVLTLWIMVAAYRFVDTNIADPVNKGIRLGVNNVAKVWNPLAEVEAFKPTNEELRAERLVLGIAANDATQDSAIIPRLRAIKIHDWWEARWYMRMIGIVVAIVAVYFAGRLLGGFFGRRIYRKIEGVITTVPVFKQVYPHVKQVVDFLFRDDRQVQFSRVVLVQYPRKGIWAIGLLTGDTMRSIASHSGDAVTVFIPSSPVPATGYTITVPRGETIDLPISVEEAMRFTISGGVLIPPQETIQMTAHPSSQGTKNLPGADDDDDAKADSPAEHQAARGDIPSRRSAG